ncbi:MAG: PIN domain-containing protein [Thermodesulfovibrionales bacterium]
MLETTKYVLDTSALMEKPKLVRKLGNRAIIPIAVIRELDGLKNSSNPAKAKAARKASRAIEEYRPTIYHGQYEKVEGLESEADLKIVGTALKLQKEIGDVALVTTDVNMRNVARAYGIKSEVLKVHNIFIDVLIIIAGVIGSLALGLLNIPLIDSLIPFMLFFFVLGLPAILYKKRKFKKYPYLKEVIERKRSDSYEEWREWVDSGSSDDYWWYYWHR